MSNERTMGIEMARMLVGDPDAIVGSAKMIFCDHEDSSIFGGISLDLLSKEHKNWEMAVGTLIFVPIKRFISIDDNCGWSIEDHLAHGMEMRYWEEK